MTDFSLDLIGQTLLAMRADMREMREQLNTVDNRLTGLESRLDQTLTEFRDELTVTSAMVMRYSSDHIAWGAMERQIKALADRLAKVESRLPAAE